MLLDLPRWFSQVLKNNLLIPYNHQDEREDENHEHIFHLQIKRKSLKRRLKESFTEYKRITELLRDRGRGQEANDAEAKLQEVCTFQSDSFLVGIST